MFLVPISRLLAAFSIFEVSKSIRQSNSCTYDAMHASGQPIPPPPYAPQTVATVSINNKKAFDIDGSHLSSNPCSALGAIKQLRGLSNDDHVICVNNSCPELNI